MAGVHCRSALWGCLLVICIAQGAFGTDLQHHTESGKWELCGPQREIEFSSFTTTLEGTIEDGYMILEVEGTLLKPIYNGTYDFKVTHVREGEEIGYKGPYDLCCTFFYPSPCEWEGTYPNQELVGGCPVPAGPFKARIRRPLWIRASGAFRAEINLQTDAGVNMGCVRSWGVFEPKPVLRGIEIIDNTARDGGGGGTGLVPVDKADAEEEREEGGRGRGGRWRRTATLGSEGSSRKTHVVQREGEESGESAVPARRERGGRREGEGEVIGDAEKDVEGSELENLDMIRAGRNWTGTYKALSECGAGCCCLHDEAAEFTFEDKVKNDHLMGHMSVRGKVTEGSEGACKGNQRMNMRNFVFTKSGDLNVMEKRYCQSACQTVRARRRITEQGRVQVSLLNVQHQQCGEQVFECLEGPCAAAVDLAASGA